MSSRSSFHNPDAVRNFVFGVEDSLVSTVALVSGIAVVGVSVSTIILTGTILVMVEAFSMAAGSLLSDNSADEYEKHSGLSLKRSVTGAMIMFVSYVVSGFLIMVPYVFFDTATAFSVSIGVSLVALFGLGVISAHLSGVHIWRKALMMVFIGGAAIILGIGVGSIVSGVV